jgi:hypothetical protein
MALPATDNFNRADGALGANWAGSVGADPTIKSNVAIGPSGGGDASMYWSADAPNAAQYAQVKHTAAASYAGVFCRGSATDWVFLDAMEGSGWDIEWYHGGAWTVIGSAYSTAPAASDVAKITADGSAFKAYINGTERISGSNASAPATGYGGIYIYSDDDKLDDFEVGNLAAAGVTVPLMYLHLARQRA